MEPSQIDIQLSPIELNTRDWAVASNTFSRHRSQVHYPVYRLLVKEIAPNAFVEIGITDLADVYIVPFSDSSKGIQWGNAYGVSLPGLIRITSDKPPLGSALKEGRWMEHIPDIPSEDTHPLWSYAHDIYHSLRTSQEMEEVNAKIADTFLFTEDEQSHRGYPLPPPLDNWQQVGAIHVVNPDDLWREKHLFMAWSQSGIPFLSSFLHVVAYGYEYYRTHVTPFFWTGSQWMKWDKKDLLRIYINWVEPKRVFGDKVSYLFSLPQDRTRPHTAMVFHFYTLHADKWNPGLYVWGLGTTEQNEGMGGIFSTFITIPSELFYQLRKGVSPHQLLTPKDIEQVVHFFPTTATGLS